MVRISEFYGAGYGFVQTLGPCRSLPHIVEDSAQLPLAFAGTKGFWNLHKYFNAMANTLNVQKKS